MVDNDNKLGDAEENEEQPSVDHGEPRPVNRRDILEGTLASPLGTGAIPAITSETAVDTETSEVVPQSTNRTATATRESRKFTVLLTNFETKWTSGWTSAEYFESAGSEYYFLLKESDGRVNVHDVKNHNGYIGSDIERHDWTSGWTSVEFYEVDGQIYLFLLKEGDGEVHIHEMNDDGTVGTYKFKHGWASGWTSVEFYEDGGQTYLFLLKEGDGEVHIHEMKSNGNVGGMVTNTTTESGWTSAEFFDAGGQTYLFLLKEADGEVHVHEVNGGNLGSRKHTYDWASGWTTVEFYEAGGRTHVFLLKEGDGEVHIHGMNDDGSVGGLKYAYDWASGWTSATFYRPDSRGYHHCRRWPDDVTYLSLIKESNGEGHLHEMNADGSVGTRLNPDEPQSVSFYDDLLTESGSGEGLVADYWRSVSLGQMDLKGSKVYGWITIPKSWEEVKSNNRWGKIQASKQAAENASGPPSSLPNRRIVAVHSEPPDSGASGRNILAHPVASGVTFFAHEMGHCFDDKIPHSASNLKPGTYHDPWDVMSAMRVCRSVYAEHDPEGPIGPGLNAYNIHDQGWLTKPELDIVDPDDQMTTERTIKSLSKPYENSGERLVLQVNTPYDPNGSYHYFVELRTQHNWDGGIEAPMVMIHKIVYHHGDDKPSRLLRRPKDHNHPDTQGTAHRPPMGYVFDDDERIGITAKSVQQTIQPEGGNAEIYVATQPGNVRLHQLDRARIGGEIGRHDWAEGWTSAEFYEVGGTQYLFLLKEGDGEVHIHEMNDDGTVGTYKFKHGWAAGWTSVEFYEAGGETYLSLLKEGGSSGRIHIHEMKANGNVGKMTTNIPISSGLTAETFTIGGQPFLFLMEQSTSKVYVFEMTDYGTISTIKDARGTSYNWSTAEFYEVDGKTYLFLLRDLPTGRIHIYEMNSDGSLGTLVSDTSIDPGQTNVEFYEAGGQTYFFQLKVSDGRLSIREMDDDGSLGDETHSREWSSDWTTATVYEADGDPHLFLLKENGV